MRTGADPTGSSSFSPFHIFFLSFRQRNQCKREGGVGSSRRLLFSTKFRAPPLSASLSAGERGGYERITHVRSVVSAFRINLRIQGTGGSSLDWHDQVPGSRLPRHQDDGCSFCRKATSTARCWMPGSRMHEEPSTMELQES